MVPEKKLSATPSRSKIGNYPIQLVLLLLWLVAFFALPSLAQDELNVPQQLMPGEAPSLRFENLGLEDGLSQGTVYDIMQDEEGYLWLTTQDGLHRYDGYEFKVFNSIPFDSTSLSSNTVQMVAEGNKGYLWVTTQMEGLNKMDKTTGISKHYRHNPDDSTSLSSNNTFDVLQSKNGDLWVSTADKGLNVMRAGQDGHFEHYRHDPENPNSLSDDVLYWMHEDKEGNIWVSSNKGLNRLNVKTGEVSRFFYNQKGKYQNDGLSTAVLNFYLPPGEPDIAWLATPMGLVRLNTQTGEHKRFVIDPDGPADKRTNRIYKVTPDPFTPGILWLAGPATGLVRFNTSTEEFTTYQHDPRDPSSLPDNSIWDLFTDRTGKMWIGNNGKGFSSFNPGAVNFSHLRNDPDNLSSLAPGIVWGIYEDLDKTLWVSTEYASEGNFVTQLDVNGIKRHQNDPDNAATLIEGSFITFAEDNSGQFWIGGNRGLNRLDRKTGQVKRYIFLPAEENYERNYISVILPMIKDSSQLWIGRWSGLELFDTKTEQHTPFKLSLEGTEKNLPVLSLFHSSDGTLWVGTMEGLFKIDSYGQAKLVSAYDPNNRNTINNNDIAGIYERRKEPGILWLATLGGGLNRFDTKAGTATHYMLEEGLPNNVIYGILEDDNGTLWMSTNHGISNFDPDEESFRNYSLDDGLIELEYAQFAYAKGADGMMYFGHPSGLTAFQPEKLVISETPPKVLLSGLKVFNKEVIPGPDSPLKKPISETGKVTLKYTKKEISFDFVALHYGNPAKNTYAYMLEGFDDDWVDAGTRRSASYTNLDPGDYTFKVKAANADGVWNNEGASVQLTILPPWYQTWWAYLIFAGLLVSAVVGIYKFQRQRHRKEEQERAVIREAELRAEAENKRNADTERLSKIGRAITSTLSITRVIDIVYEHVNQLMDAAIFGVGIYNKEKERLEFPAAKEEGEMLLPYSLKLTEANRLAVLCFNNKKEIIIGDYQRERKNYITNYLPPITGKSTQSIIYLPLVHQDRMIGVITTQSFNTNSYSAYHIELLRNLATYAAIAIDNASAYKQLNETLTELKATQEQLVQQEKLASLGQLTAGIAHEIKNPLNFVNNFSELSVEMVEEAREELSRITPSDPKENESLSTISSLLNDIKTNLKRIVKHGTRADGIVRSMLQHSRGGSGKLNLVDINALIREYVNLSFHAMRAGKHPINVEIDLQLDEQAGEVSLIEEDFSRVIINICNNAFDAMREKSKSPSVNGNYLPKLSVKSSRQDGFVHVTFEDNGPGIPSIFRNQILQPFFTTKKGNQGTGLGLSITNDIIKSHRGTLDIYSEEGAFSRFVIQIPHEQNQVIL